MNFRIYDQTNQCVCLSAGSPVLLQLLHSAQPTLQLTSNPTGNCLNDIDGYLSLHRLAGINYSLVTSTSDLELVASHKARNLVLSTRHYQSSIKFATTATNMGPDMERMRITPQGHVGIAQTEPLELLHVWRRLVLHAGTNEDYIGYNLYNDAQNVQRSIEGFSGTNQTHALKLGFTFNGNLLLGAGTAETEDADEEINWFENGSSYDFFPGLTIRQHDGYGSAAFGKFWPDHSTRLLIRGFPTDESCTTDACTTNAMRVLTSNNTEVMRIRNNARIGIHQTSPKEILHVGDLITFHNGGSKWMGFNVWWDNQEEKLKNLEGGRVSAMLGIGHNQYHPGLAIFQVDKAASAGDEVYAGQNFKGWVMDDAGNMGIATMEPGARLHVKGNVVIGEKACTTSVTGAKLSVDGTIFGKDLWIKPTDWADYKLKPDYKLRTIEELQNLIYQCGHLPDMPSEADVLENGISIGKMQARTLGAIEELTLYVIELFKENKQLRIEVNELKERIK